MFQTRHACTPLRCWQFEFSHICQRSMHDDQQNLVYIVLKVQDARSKEIASTPGDVKCKQNCRRVNICNHIPKTPTRDTSEERKTCGKRQRMEDILPDRTREISKSRGIFIAQKFRKHQESNILEAPPNATLQHTCQASERRTHILKPDTLPCRSPVLTHHQPDCSQA